MPSQDDGSAGQSVGVLDFFKKAAEASLVLAVFLYVVGWSYLYGYYKTFGLDLRQVGISLQEAMIFSAAALFNDWIVVVMLASVGVAVIILVALEKHVSTRYSALLFFFFVFALYGAVSWRASYVGRDSAIRHARADNGTLPSVMVWVDLKKIPEASDINSDLHAGDKYKLLLQTSDAIWVFRPVPDPVAADDRTQVIMIPSSAVTSLSVERNLH